MRRWLEQARRTVLSWPGETAVVVASVVGWAFLTWAATDVFGSTAWKAGAGLLLLGGVGFGFLGEIARDGLYVLTILSEDEPQ